MLKTTTLPLITIFLVPALIYGQGSQSPANTPPAQEWSKFESKECAFSALFPMTPQLTDVKGKVTMHVFAATVGSERYIVKCSKFPDKETDPLRVQQLLESARNQLVGMTGGRMVEDRRLAQSGFRGREIKIELSGFDITIRILWVKQRLYQVSVETPLRAAKAEARKKFFNSFALDGYPNDTAVVDDVEGTDSPPSTQLSEFILKGKALRLVTPEYPRSASGQRVRQRIEVEIVINETGHVISAHASKGDPDLRAAAEAAAKASTFAPTIINGIAVKVSGVLTYNFGP